MKAIILAAGKGTRLHSAEAEMPKALHDLRGRPLISYVLENLDFLQPKDIIIVVGFLGEKVKAALGDQYRYVEQQELNGTARATMCAEPLLVDNTEPVLVCYCDMPFLRRETYQKMFRVHEETGAGNTVLSARIHPIPAYGRLIRDASGALVDIIEDSACTPEQKRIDEVNVGIQVLDGARMWDWLRQVNNENPKREYYLTGLVRVLHEAGVKQATVELEDLTETAGVNSPEDLAAAERLLDARARKKQA